MKRFVIPLLCVSLCAGIATAQTGVNERGAWEIWKLMDGGTNDPATVVAACDEFRKNNPLDPLGDVIRGIAAWELLKAENIPAAAKMLVAMPTTANTPLQKAAAEMARTWLTRIDMEHVKLALTALYRQNVEYPASLDALARLPQSSRPPLTDRWGKPWDYALTGFKFLEGFNSQKYRIRSTVLGEESDLARALEIPYASRINIEPLQRAGQGDELIVFVTTDETRKRVMLSERVAFGNIALAYAGSRILILSDGNHWKFTAAPQR